MGECPENDEDFCMAGIDVSFDFCDKAVMSMRTETDEFTYDLVLICVECGRNASIVWWKCCPDHTTEYGIDVICQTCVEKFHPNDEEFARP